MSTERDDLAGARWVTSSRSGSSGANCVEVAGLSSGIAVRDSKNRSAGVLRISADRWADFLGSLPRL